MHKTNRNYSIIAIMALAAMLSGCTVNTPPDSGPSSTTVIHDKTPSSPTINVTPPASSHTDTTTTVTPPGGGGSTTTQSSTTG